MESENGQVQTQTVQATQQQGVADILGINFEYLGLQLINFAVVVVIVWFMILKPLGKKLEERKDIIDRSLDKAKEIETNLKMSERKFDEIIANAKAEANDIIEHAKKKADELALKTKAEAIQEVNRLVSQAKKQIASEKEKMVEEVTDAAIELVVLATEKIISEKMDSKKDEALIKKTIAALADKKK